WREISRFNPFFYMVDGLRYGFLGVSDVTPGVSLAVVGAALAVVTAACLALLRSGYKIRL
ncbi:MAG: metal-dependent hydrolase, partial [Gammaproteobacteria bacterium]|nr:metal-dependent hydrolase [Gammaproteobacteria bacterium]